MQDVRVALRYSDSGTESLLLFFTGAVDLAYVGIVPFTMGLAYGLPLRVLAVAQAAGPSHAVVARSGAGTSGEPVRIATVFGSSGHFVGWRWAQAQGLRAMFVDLPPQDQTRAFHQGYVQAVATWEPHVAACLTADAEVAFRADELPFPMMDLLVASDATAQRASDADRVVALHRRVARHLAEGPADQDIEYLQGLFRTRWTPAHARRMLSSAFTAATTEDLEHLRPDLEAGVAAIEAFAAATGLSTLADGPGVDHPFVLGWGGAPEGGRAGGREELRVGYSDDLMCAPLLLGRMERMNRGSGVAFVRQPRREVERIASLSDTLRESVEQARELISVDPALATIKMARLVELNLRAVADHVMGANAPKQVSAVIAGLEERSVLPHSSRPRPTGSAACATSLPTRRA